MSLVIQLPDLPYTKSALSPHISEETLQFHHGKHHAAYVDNLNRLLPGTAFADEADLESIIRAARPGGTTHHAGIFNNAAQVWNHTFYWHSLSPVGGGEPHGPIAQAIERDFGSFSAFQTAFTQTALTTFGSGWAWLVQGPDKKLTVLSTSNADTPIAHGDHKPLLTCDVWEHAYYIDYRNARPAYLTAFWALVNWEFANQRLVGA